MQKIPTLYVRNPDDRRFVTDEVAPGCDWVLAGEGLPTRKFDGTCLMCDAEDRWWARREVKPGKPAPDGFREVSEDDVTGKVVGWEPIEQSPFVKFWREAIEVDRDPGPGTYELVGPKVNGNPERLFEHRLVAHDGSTTIDPGQFNVGSPAAAIATAREQGWEGIVWHHPDGRMAKLKVRDCPL